MECAFCERLARQREARPKGVRENYSAALVIWQRGSWAVALKNKGVRFPLLYCPECGKELKK
nr:MAG TPA: MqsA [Caudoviricetes sp.]